MIPTSLKSARKLVLAAFVLVSGVLRSASADLATEVASHFGAPPGSSSGFYIGAGMGTNGIVFDNRVAQSFVSSTNGQLSRVEVSGFRRMSTTAPLRVDVVHWENGQPGQLLGSAIIPPEAVPTEDSGYWSTNITAVFSEPRAILRAGEWYGLVLRSDTTEASYSLKGGRPRQGLFRSQNGRPFVPSNGALFHTVVVFANRAPVVTSDVVATRGGAVTFDPLANDWDIEGDPLTITGVTTPQHGRVKIIGNKLRYIPDTSVTEPDIFAYFVQDEVGKRSIASVRVINPFYSVRGRSEAVVRDVDRSAGHLVLKVTKSGQVTGKLKVEGRAYTFKRPMELDGSLSTTLKVRGRKAGQLDLIYRGGSEPVFSGTVAVAGRSYEIGLGGGEMDAEVSGLIQENRP